MSEHNHRKDVMLWKAELIRALTRSSGLTAVTTNLYESILMTTGLAMISLADELLGSTPGQPRT